VSALAANANARSRVRRNARTDHASRRLSHRKLTTQRQRCLPVCLRVAVITAAADRVAHRVEKRSRIALLYKPLQRARTVTRHIHRSRAHMHTHSHTTYRLRSRAVSLASPRIAHTAPPHATAPCVSTRYDAHRRERSASSTASSPPSSSRAHACSIAAASMSAACCSVSTASATATRCQTACALASLSARSDCSA
jgi:hypothetical protein